MAALENFERQKLFPAAITNSGLCSLTDTQPARTKLDTVRRPTFHYRMIAVSVVVAVMAL
jgi:hypothetical protein